MLDTKTKEELDKLTTRPNLNIIVHVALDKYTGLNRQMMEQMNIIKEFWNNKADIMSYALQHEKDTMFLDSDVFILNPIICIDNSKEIGLSPHYVKKSNTDEVGYYNGGCVWTKNKNVPECWKKHTVNSRYVDQASLEDVAKDYVNSMFEFGEEINFMPWRILLANNPNEVVNNINIKDNKLNYKDSPLVFLHTHFLDQRFAQINTIFINALKKLKRYKELAIIERIIHNKWIIKIPKQPQEGLWRHNNDSFRELALLFQKNNYDVKIELTDSGHCLLAPNILLYDRPTDEWFNNELVNTSLILLGNCDIEKEGKVLKDNGLNIKPWIFWPRRPFIMEKFLTTNSRKQYADRKIDSIFIGNIENSTQNQFRNTQKNWEQVLDVYHCTQGTQHKFTQEEYLEKLSNAKYGLALRGYGSKCHREVELMALGTVPIITPEVSINSYMNPPQENVHYITVTTPEELKEKIQSIPEEQWVTMSQNCYNWYHQNVYSKNSMNTILTNILYT
tara:strand:+ start:3880 stop:5394 length:1515 start_codon:yes stop_codon:yes gene_type:complete